MRGDGMAYDCDKDMICVYDEHPLTLYVGLTVKESRRFAKWHHIENGESITLVARDVESNTQLWGRVQDVVNALWGCGAIWGYGNKLKESDIVDVSLGDNDYDKFFKGIIDSMTKKGISKWVK